MHVKFIYCMSILKSNNFYLDKNMLVLSSRWGWGENILDNMGPGMYPYIKSNIKL